MYKIAGGGKEVSLKKTGDRLVEIEIEGKSAKINVNDLAWAVKECMPEGEAEKTFAMIDEREVRSGKAQVRVKAYKDIKKDEMVVFTIDITKYLDSQGRAAGVRMTKSGFIF